jgi:hypothetical protein
MNRNRNRLGIGQRLSQAFFARQRQFFMAPKANRQALIAASLKVMSRLALTTIWPDVSIQALRLFVTRVVHLWGSWRRMHFDGTIQTFSTLLTDRSYEIRRISWKP